MFKGEATQPNPIAESTETLRTSETIDVITGDMELYVPNAPIDGLPATLMHMQRFPLHNRAHFTVVSRDRLRFHVQVEHKGQEWADLDNWSAKLEDDRGHVWQPEGLDHATTQLEVQMWDYEIRSASYTQSTTPPACTTTAIAGARRSARSRGSAARATSCSTSAISCAPTATGSG